MVQRNVVANYLGRAWSGVMGLAFIPVYIHHLGIEAWGLIGIFALVQSWLALLDMGLSPTLNREMARFTAGAQDARSIRDLLRSVEVVCFALASCMAIAIWAMSGWIARDWLNPSDLSPPVVAAALSIMAVVVALRFCEGIYRSSLFGLQQQVWYNVAQAGVSALRYLGAVVVVAWIAPTVQAFFVWQAVVSLLAVLLYAVRVNRTLPRLPDRPRFSLPALRRISRFATGMVAITALSVALTSVDKVLLSRLLHLEHFGYYMLATSMATVLFMLIMPVTEAVYPRMVELVELDDTESLAGLYHRAAQLVAVLTAPAALVLSFFATGVIFAWSGDPALAGNTAPILSALVLGSFLNGLVWVPFRCQLAHGWTGLVVRANVLAVLLLIPAIFWVVPRFGAVGAAWVWVMLNTGYVLFLVQLMHRRVLPREKWRWYGRDTALPAGAALAVVLLATLVQPSGDGGRIAWALFLLGTGAGATAAAASVAGELRGRLFQVACRSARLPFTWLPARAGKTP
jgi:O-antigen/teichoic acid export membrane protein